MKKIKAIPSVFAYPGGKSKQAVELVTYCLQDGPSTFAVPFGGGGSELLCAANADPDLTLFYNDKDARIAALFSVLANKDERPFRALMRLVESTVPSVELFDDMKTFSPDPANFYNRNTSKVLWAYAGLIRNRLAFSGIMHQNAGVKGGRGQNGTRDTVHTSWMRDTTIKRLHRMRRLLVGRTTVSAWDFEAMPYTDAMVIDPPYVRKANKLYAHWFTYEDHVRLAEWVMGNPSPNRWIVTYDNDPLVERLYADAKQQSRDMTYSIAQGGGAGAQFETELWVTNPW